MNCGMCDAHFSEEWLEAQGINPKEGVECPNCKWSTTIETDENAVPEDRVIELEDGATLLLKEGE